ncbi:hypothetical protein PVMG_04026 [Plasmodium vivax Mauritania I]|uniref:Uncharacterized protein n=1 Tax=Plasmodium vivax Mauritania I TaxID=1035515 RepID=A0A0J9T877_PLAVI|nr:hypothetical protein PVMG_04026 [Plasmodium vivax Mauritania I]
MRVNQLDGEIVAIEERHSKEKRKNGKLVQGHDESKEYTELGRTPQVRKDLTSETHRIREDYPGYEQTFYQKGSQGEIKMTGESNAKEDTWLKPPRNDTEHYNIMSSTDTLLSSDDSVADMYETNYKYFLVRKFSLSEESPGSASDWQDNLKLDRPRSHQNGVFQEDRRIVRLPKPYGRSEPRNGKVLEKNTISNFNPLAHISTKHHYYNPCARHNCNGNHFSYDYPCGVQNGSLRYGCHPFCEPHDGKYLHAADGVSQNEGNFYMNKKCTLKFDNYLKGMYFTNRSYMEAELRKKCSHYFLPLRRPFRAEGSNTGAASSGGPPPKRGSVSSGSSGSSGEFSANPVDPVDRLNGRTHPHGEKHQTRSHNLRKGRKCKGDEYHRRKNANHESTCPSKKNLFSQLLKNLKLLGYALFFCFFISNENKAIREKQNSTRGGKKAFPNSSSLKSERRRK